MCVPRARWIRDCSDGTRRREVANDAKKRRIMGIAWFEDFESLVVTGYSQDLGSVTSRRACTVLYVLCVRTEMAHMGFHL